MSTVSLSLDLRTRREAVVRAHIDAENNHDVEATLRTFHHARYEVMPFGEPTDGADAVRALVGTLMGAFPDFHAEALRTRHAEDCVIVEIRMTGTHRGDWLGVAPTGRKMDLPVACFFEFEEDRLVCERVYFDHATLLRQLGA